MINQTYKQKSTTLTTNIQKDELTVKMKKFRIIKSLKDYLQLQENSLKLSLWFRICYFNFFMWKLIISISFIKYQSFLV